MKQDDLSVMVKEMVTDGDFKDRVFSIDGIYFILTSKGLLEIKNDDAYAEDNGVLKPLLTGLLPEDRDGIEEIMDRYDIDTEFFLDMEDNCDMCEIENEDFLDFFNDNADSSDIRKIQCLYNDIQTKSIPFDSLLDLMLKLKRFDLNPDILYYDTGDAIVPMYKYIQKNGEEIGTFENMSEDDWIDILTNIEDYRINLCDLDEEDDDAE